MNSALQPNETDGENQGTIESQRDGSTKPGKGMCARQRSSLGDTISRKFWFLDSRDLCAAARRSTGLNDFGDPPVEPALSLLTNSLEQEANLHPLGRFLIRVHLRGLLETRLRLADLWRQRAEGLTSAPIERPIFITGMPRSGSTFLHELLSEDPDHRTPRVWEVMFPIPKSKHRATADPRIRKAAMCLWMFRRLAPQADAVFPMRAHSPHECVAIHSHTFLSEEFISTCRIPTYESFLRHADLRPSYTWERRFLQHLQSGQTPRRWVLKSPDHVYGLERLFSVFPDALIVQTHRNPLEVLKSSCQLTEVLHGLYARPGNREELAAREVRVLADGMDRLVEFRDAHPELADRFVDVKYTELVSDPLGVVEQIYRHFDIPFTRTASERMRHLAGLRSRYSNNRREPADLRPEMLAEVSRFERYCARFRIAWQRPFIQ